jgi:YgiT-type zinc finger domain-containing protein
MKDEYPMCILGAPVSVPKMTDDEIRGGLKAAGAVIMQGCECGGCFERVDDIVVDTVVDGERIIVRHLHGLVCTGCGMEALSPESMRTVERRIREKHSSVRFGRPVHVAREASHRIPV